MESLAVMPTSEEVMRMLQELEAGHAQLRDEMSKLKVSGLVTRKLGNGARQSSWLMVVQHNLDVVKDHPDLRSRGVHQGGNETTLTPLFRREMKSGDDQGSSSSPFSLSARGENPSAALGI
ncbi:hypothetical protein Droror1_Dr00010167 [Drosera rotundifolia]